VTEVVDFVAHHYPNPRPTAQLLEQFGLSGLARRQTGGLSGGEKRRLAVALALVGNPTLVLLDEPTTGLDVDGRLVLWEALRAYHATGGTIVLTSHYLEEVQALAERVIVIDHGHVLADDTLADVIGRVAVRRVALTLPDAADLAALRGLPGVVDVGAVGAGGTVGNRVELLTSDADALVRELIRADTAFSDLEVRSASLEEAFLALTRKEVAA